MRRYLILGIVSVALLTASSYLGARAGYDAGRLDSMYRAPGEGAADLAGTLQLLRSGNVSDAETLMEARLDNEFVERWLYDRQSNRVLSFLRPPENEALVKLIGSAAQYRASHPCVPASPRVGAIVGEVVAKYEPHAVKPRMSPN